MLEKPSVEIRIICRYLHGEKYFLGEEPEFEVMHLTFFLREAIISQEKIPVGFFPDKECMWRQHMSINALKTRLFAS